MQPAYRSDHQSTRALHPGTAALSTLKASVFLLGALLVGRLCSRANDDAEDDNSVGDLPCAANPELRFEDRGEPRRGRCWFGLHECLVRRANPRLRRRTSARAAGACCASCIPDSTSDCDEGQTNYQSYRDWLIGISSSCLRDGDCSVLFEQNPCTHGCGVPASEPAGPAVLGALKDYATNNCSTCAPPKSLSCAPLRAACMNGICALEP